MGFTPEELQKPLIGVVNSFSEVVPGHMHLRELADAVKIGVASAGGTAMEFPAIGVCDGFCQGTPGMRYSLPTRELIADSTEAMTNANSFDGLVLIPNCDKIIPGMLMAAARLNIPCIVVSGGPMLAGRLHGTHMSTAVEAVGLYESGKITAEELEKIEMACRPGVGSCSGLFTANSMNCLTEVLGLGLPGNGTIPAVMGERKMLAKRAGIKIMELVEKDLKPKDIMTMKAFENAIVVDNAIGGSSNTVLHLMAIAYEAGIELPLTLFDEISAKTPYLTKLSPTGSHHMEDLNEAGGISAVMKELTKLGLIHTDALTVDGTIGDRIKNAGIDRPDVIRSVENPYRKKGGIAILFGNLAPEGAVVKESAVPEDRLVFEGKARVFEVAEEAQEAILGGKIHDGDVVVIRYEGPKGGPGMKEMLNSTAAITGMGIRAALITDGRFSGVSRGVAVGHICPEAAAGGPIGLVNEGDVITIDIPKKQLNVKVSDDELAQRRAAWVKPQPKVMNGYLVRYANAVSSASTGAILK
jgi:dihydroxy-acid dehydratase